MSKKMTGKQSQFCREYVVDFNGSAAAIRAGYSKKSAKVIACRMLQTDPIQQEIQRLMAETNEKIGIDAQYVREKLLRVVEETLPDETKVDRMGRPLQRKVDYVAALKAVEMLARNIGFFEKDNMQQGQVGVPQVEMLGSDERNVLKEALIEFLGAGRNSAGESGSEDRSRVTH